MLVALLPLGRHGWSWKRDPGTGRGKKKKGSGFVLDERERVRVRGGMDKRREIAREGESVLKRRERRKGMGDVEWMEEEETARREQPTDLLSPNIDLPAAHGRSSRIATIRRTTIQLLFNNTHLPS